MKAEGFYSKEKKSLLAEISRIWLSCIVIASGGRQKLLKRNYCERHVTLLTCECVCLCFRLFQSQYSCHVLTVFVSLEHPVPVGFK